MPIRCTTHHLIWFDGDPDLTIGCAHCPHISQLLDLRPGTPEALIRALIEDSRSTHARACDHDSHDGRRSQ